MTNSDNLLLKALKRQETHRPPVWLMRQAGRYLEEYRALKAKHSFLELCHSPELAVEVTLQPIRALDVDAAIIFADILLPLQGMGLELEFSPGPIIRNPVTSPEDVNKLCYSDPEVESRAVLSTVSGVIESLTPSSGKPRDKAVLGFAGAPWTMACYLIKQPPFKQFASTSVFAKRHPKAFKELMRKLTDVVRDYLLAQANRGADAVQLFDTWAGILSLDDYRDLALPYTAEIVSAVQKAGIPVTVFAQGTSHLLPALIESQCDCISVDWKSSLAWARESIPEQIAIQGNLDPSHLFSSPETVQSECAQMLKVMQGRKSYIANLGHGVLPETPRECVQVFVNTVKEGI
jgi:uroporphyrinogen decarboxylase